MLELNHSDLPIQENELLLSVVLGSQSGAPLCCAWLGGWAWEQNAPCLALQIRTAGLRKRAVISAPMVPHHHSAQWKSAVGCTAQDSAGELLR